MQPKAITGLLVAIVVLLGRGCAGSSSPNLSGDRQLEIDQTAPSDEDLTFHEAILLKDLPIYEAVVFHYWRYGFQTRAKANDGAAWLCLTLLFFDPSDEFLERLKSRGLPVRRGSEFREDVDELLVVGTYSIPGDQDDKRATVIVGSFRQEGTQHLIYHLVEAEDEWKVSHSHELGKIQCNRCNPGMEQLLQDDRLKDLFSGSGR